MASIYSHRLRKAVAAVGVAIRSAANEADLTSPVIISGAGAPSGDEGFDHTHMLYLRNDASSVDTLAYLTFNGGTGWNAIEAGTKAAGDISLTDAGAYWTATDVEAALQELFASALGGTDSTTRPYTEDNVLTDDQTFYASLDALDLKWGDLASVANGEGTALVGAEDAGGYFATATAEGQLQEVGLFAKRLTPALVNRLFDDFNDKQAGFTELDSAWILNKGSDGAAADPDVVAAEGGSIRLTSGAAGSGIVADGSQFAGAHPVQADSGNLIFEARVNLADITGSAVFVGLTDSTALEIPATIGGGDTISLVADDCVGFLFDPAADTDEWFGVAADGTVQDAGNATTTVAPANGVYQRLTLTVSADGATIAFAIDGTTELTLTGDVGVSPDVNLYPTIVTISAGAASKTVDCDYIYLAVDR